MIDKVYHLHQMVTGLRGLWQPSTATQDILYLHPTQGPVRVREAGISRTQHATKVMNRIILISKNNISSYLIIIVLIINYRPA